MGPSMIFRFYLGDYSSVSKGEALKSSRWLWHTFQDFAFGGVWKCMGRYSTALYTICFDNTASRDGGAWSL